jgi:hypothetical protein
LKVLKTSSLGGIIILQFFSCFFLVAKRLKNRRRKKRGQKPKTIFLWASKKRKKMSAVYFFIILHGKVLRLWGRDMTMCHCWRSFSVFLKPFLPFVFWQLNCSFKTIIIWIFCHNTKNLYILKCDRDWFFFILFFCL